MRVTSICWLLQTAEKSRHVRCGKPDDDVCQLTAQAAEKSCEDVSQLAIAKSATAIIMSVVVIIAPTIII